jgi:hypothetical protein
MILAIVIAFLAFATGVTSKFADLLNEHGITWFRGAGVLSGLLWGVLATLLTLTDRWVAVVWAGTVLFWFLRCKLDHFNHAFAGVAVLVAALYMAHDRRLSVLAVGLFALWLYVSALVNTELKRRGMLPGFLRLRLRYYAGPLVVGLLAHSWLPVVAIVAGMLGTELITVWHASVARAGASVSGPLGISYDASQDSAMPVSAEVYA